MFISERHVCILPLQHTAEQISTAFTLCWYHKSPCEGWKSEGGCASATFKHASIFY